MRRSCAAILICCAGLAGCGFDVQSPDLFVLTRTGASSKLTLLFNDSGTVRCNGAAAKPLPDPLLLQARDLATSLDGDAKAQLRIRAPADSVYTYTVTLQDGTISFPDTAGAHHSELAQAQQLTLSVAQGVCRLSG